MFAYRWARRADTRRRWRAARRARRRGARSSPAAASPCSAPPPARRPSGAGRSANRVTTYRNINNNLLVRIFLKLFKSTGFDPCYWCFVSVFFVKTSQRARHQLGVPSNIIRQPLRPPLLKYEPSRTLIKDISAFFQAGCWGIWFLVHWEKY